MRALALFLLTLVACGGEQAKTSTEPKPEPEGCVVGEIESDGACLPAGILPEECSEGFESDGAFGCAPTVTDCSAGQVAWLGETACHAIAPCPEGDWPDAPVEPNTQFVDTAYGGGDSDGSQARPWASLQAAFDVAEPGAMILLAAGTHAEEAVMRTDGLRLIGVCPDRTRLEGLVVDRPALFVNGADGGLVRGLSIGGPGTALAVQDTAGVTVEEVALSEAAQRGLVATPFTTNVLELIMRRVLVENTNGAGAFIGGGSVVLEDVIVRGVLFDGEWGDGIAATSASPAPPVAISAARLIVRDVERAGVVTDGATLSLTDSSLSRIGPHADGRGLWTDQTDLVLEGITITDVEGSAAIAISDGDAQLDRVTVRDVRPSGTAPGVGLFSTPVERTSPALALRRTSIGGVHTVGVIGANTLTTLERLRVVDVGPDPIAMAGAGISVATYLNAGLGDGIAQLDARGVLIERATRVGLGLYGVQGELRSVAVKDVLTSVDGTLGRCMDVEIALSVDVRSAITFDRGELGGCHEGGLFLFGSTLEASDLFIHDVLGDVEPGYGLAMHYDPATYDAPMGSLSGGRIENVARTGIFIGGGGDFALSNVVIHGVVAGPDGLFGDGVVVSGADTPEGFVPSSASVTGCVVSEVARAAMSSFGGTVAIEDNDLSCAPIPLNQEPAEAGEGFVDGGGNDCACGDEAQACKALSGTLEAPAPPSPVGGSPL